MKEQSIKRTNNNCLSFIRIIAAFQVLLGHMIEHLELPGNNSILHATYFFRGVPIFFVISGFLIWFSMDRSKTYGNYLKKRFWRIYPELWMAVIIEIFLLVVLYEGWNLKQLMLFALGQGTLFQFWTPDSLRGYGVGAPNGALWTIGVMIQFYIIAWFFYKFMKNRNMIEWVMGFIVSFVISWLGTHISQNMFGTDIIGKLYDQTFIKYFWLFYFGMFIARFQEKLLPVFKRYWYAFICVAFAFFWTGWDLFSGYFLLWSLLLTAGLIGFAYRFPQLSIGLDISYGIFLYHMIVVNIFVIYHWIGSWLYVIPVIIIVSALAYCSAKTIGKASANRKGKLVL